jgi:hypothetical protein
MEASKYTLTAVAHKVATDLEDFSGHKILSYINWAKAGWRGLQEEVMKEVKAVKLPMNAYFAVDLPSDCIDWTKVGIQYGDKILVLGVADDIALLQDETDCGEKIANTPHPGFDDIMNGTNLEAYTPFYFNNFYGAFPAGNYSDGLYGYYAGLPYKGFFRENKAARQIQFSSSVKASEIYMEYITDGSVCNGSTQVDPLAFDYLVQFVHYERIKFRQDIADSLKERTHSDLHYAFLKLTRLTAGITMKDIVNGTRKGYRMTPHV